MKNIEDKITFFNFVIQKKYANTQTNKQTNRQTITAGGRCLQRCIQFTCSLQHVASQHIETRPELFVIHGMDNSAAQFQTIYNKKNEKSLFLTNLIFLKNRFF